MKTTHHEQMAQGEHSEHQVKPLSEMSFWSKFKMGRQMTKGMDYIGLAGRKMAKLTEVEIT